MHPEYLLIRTRATVFIYSYGSIENLDRESRIFSDSPLWIALREHQISGVTMAKHTSESQKGNQARYDWKYAATCFTAALEPVASLVQWGRVSVLSPHQDLTSRARKGRIVRVRCHFGSNEHKCAKEAPECCSSSGYLEASLCLCLCQMQPRVPSNLRQNPAFFYNQRSTGSNDQDRKSVV